jgi:serine/threonine protein kinase
MMPEFQTGEDALDLTRTGMVMGTPYYMSPEQARGERNLDARVDVYACGVVMYEAIAGKRPFLAPNYNALLLAIINNTAKPLRQIRPKTPPELEAVIMKAMAKNRADRFPTAKQFLRELTPNLPLADAPGARLPPPPTAEERKHAPVLGGARARPDTPVHKEQPRERHAGSSLPDASTRRGRRKPTPSLHSSHEPVDHPDGPSATLRRRMADSVGQRDKAVPRDASFDARPQDVGEIAVSVDFDIPIHVATDDDLEDPTEIFRPDRHAAPAKLAGSAPRRASPAPAEARPKKVGAKPPPTALGDDWDNDTIVRKPEEMLPLPSTLVSQQRLANRARDRRPFNPDETIKLENTSEVDIVDDSQVPRTRR